MAFVSALSGQPVCSDGTPRQCVSIGVDTRAFGWPAVSEWRL